MKCEEVKIMLPEYSDGKLSKQVAGEINRHLESCNSCREFYTEIDSFLNYANSLPEIETPAGMRDDFLNRLEMEEISVKRNVMVIPMWAKVAAMLVVAVGTYLFGYQNGTLKGEAKSNMLTAELNIQKQLGLLAGLRDYTGPQKIEAVYAISNSGQTSDNLIDALVYTMNSDKNVNVRLAAISALSGMIDQSERAKTELVKSLAVQENPLLQISLIQVLTESGVKEAKDEIETITNSEKTDESVKAFAKDMIKTII